MTLKREWLQRSFEDVFCNGLSAVMLLFAIGATRSGTVVSTDSRSADRSDVDVARQSVDGDWTRIPLDLLPEHPTTFWIHVEALGEGAGDLRLSLRAPMSDKAIVFAPPGPDGRRAWNYLGVVDQTRAGLWRLSVTGNGARVSRVRMEVNAEEAVVLDRSWDSDQIGKEGLPAGWVCVRETGLPTTGVSSEREPDCE